MSLLKRFVIMPFRALNTKMTVSSRFASLGDQELNANSSAVHHTCTGTDTLRAVRVMNLNANHMYMALQPLFACTANNVRDAGNVEALRIARMGDVAHNAKDVEVLLFANTTGTCLGRISSGNCLLPFERMCICCSRAVLLTE